MNPYNYNDSVASMFTSLSKDEAISAGFMWRNKQLKVDIPENIETVETVDL
jgi:hypothetical protein